MLNLLFWKSKMNWNTLQEIFINRDEILKTIYNVHYISFILIYTS